jgi:pyroglutamyl-peptidase
VGNFDPVAMKKILLTGFKPFHKQAINPSGELLKLFQNRCDTLLLPVSYNRSWQVLRPHLTATEYDFVLMLGQAGERKAICLERMAINLHDTETADEDGDQRNQMKISENGPDAFMNPLPLRAWSQALQNLKLPVEISFSAGAFICNSIYYQTFELMKGQGRETPILFVHVPFLPEQVLEKPEGTLSMPLETMAAAITGILEIISLNR